VVGDVEPGKFALLILHPADANEAIEASRARMVLSAVKSIPFSRIVIIYPNNDPGAGGILRTWDALNNEYRIDHAREIIARDLPRPIFLGLLRDAAVLIGNSSSGIIEAASFGTPVIDIGPRQLGRERGSNVLSVPYDGRKITADLRRLWKDGHPRRFKRTNLYGGNGTASKIVKLLTSLQIDDRLLRKLIRY
jgi:UDP-N-acetylglucosamine 2-epimerase